MKFCGFYPNIINIRIQLYFSHYHHNAMNHNTQPKPINNLSEKDISSINLVSEIKTIPNQNSPLASQQKLAQINQNTETFNQTKQQGIEIQIDN